jgi:hypothetical protein
MYVKISKLKIWLQHRYVKIKNKKNEFRIIDDILISNTIVDFNQIHNTNKILFKYKHFK